MAYDLDSTKLHELRMGNPITLSTTSSDGATGSAKLMPDWTIVARFAASDPTDHCEIETPFSFNILGVRVIARASATGGTLQVKNTTTVVTDAIDCATDKATDDAASIDDASYSFTKGDDDLRIYGAGTGSPSGIVVINVEPV